MAELHLSFQSVSSWWSSEDNLDWCHWNYRTEISHATQTKKEVWLATRKECNDWSDAFLGLAGKNNFGKGQTEVLSVSLSLTQLHCSKERPILHKRHYIHCNNTQRNESVSMCCDFTPAIYIFSRFWAWSGRSCFVF